MTDVHPLTYDSLKPLLPPRTADSHKGHFGHVLVIGGDRGMGGAVAMAGEAAGRCGAGLVSIATRAAHVPALLARRPELMAHGVEHGVELETLLERATVLVLGPGLGHGAWSRDLLVAALDGAARKELNVVLDADALNWLAKEPALLPARLQGKCLLTPHPGEAGRLLGCETSAVNADRPAAAQALQRKFGGAAVLKGSGTLICHASGDRLHVEACGHGNPGMASGGMGDVLSGVLGSLLAQGFSLADSARLGVCIHSNAADLAAADTGQRGLLATDLMPYIHLLMNPFS
jgi:hydroxyethylthiazole kinase-like uncharacterized protein yjeF